jgi:fumarylacetoacetate (FAA) hydrolase
MKLATLQDGTRDGTLVLVSNDLSRCAPVPYIARTLQRALDRWDEAEPKLRQAARQLQEGLHPNAIPFEEDKAHSPLPRAYQWADGSAYVNHVELVRKSRGVEMPESFWTDPLMYQGGSDSFIAPHADIPLANTDWGIDLEAEVAVIVGDVPMGASVEEAGKAIKLVMLVNDVSLRNLAMPELVKGFGFFNCKPSSAFSPVAVTPDALGEHWKDGKLHLPLRSYINGKPFGWPNAGVDMTFSFAQLVAHAAKTRPLCAGTIIGSGTVSNKDKSVGSSCLVEKRMLEKLETGESTTPFLQFGDRVRIEMLDENSRSIFGAIDQTVVEYQKTA